MKGRIRLRGLVLALALCLGLALPASAEAEVTQEQAYRAIEGLKALYPEGTPWDNSDFYSWKGAGRYSGGYGCVGFAYMLSDAAFGDLPSRELTGVKLEEVRVGDVLRIDGDTHSVVVLEVRDDSVVIAEGNYQGTVHWGRELGRDTVERADYLITRYPPAPAGSRFTDVPAGAWYAQAVNAMADGGVLSGRGDGSFDPDAPVTLAELAVVIQRLNGRTDLIGGEEHWAQWAMFYTCLGCEKTLVDGVGITADYSWAGEPAFRGDALSALGELAHAQYFGKYLDEYESLFPQLSVTQRAELAMAAADAAAAAGFDLSSVADRNVYYAALNTSNIAGAAVSLDGHSISAQYIDCAYGFGLTVGVDGEHRCSAFSTLTRAELAQMCFNKGWTAIGSAS